MSTHFLIDLFTNPVTSSPIIDVLEPPAGVTTINGAFVIRIPDVVPIAAPLPSVLSSLMTKKYAGLLAYYTGFGHIVFDDLLDPSGIDFTQNPLGTFGQRGSISMQTGSTLQSVATPLAIAPTAAILTWEVFTYIDLDTKTSTFSRQYNELPTTGATSTAQVSFDGGINFTSVLDSSVLSIPLGVQGSSLVVKFTNTSASKLYLGSWALIY